MRLSTLVGLSALSLAPEAFASSHARRHHELANRQEAGVVKRGNLFSNAKFTWYDIAVAQVACEGWYKPSDFVVAMNALQYGTYWKSEYCGKQVSITLNGKTATATVVDECMGCPWAGLDFSKGLFEYFSDVGAGIVYGEWHFIDGSGGGNIGGDSGNDNSATTSTKKAAATTSKIQVKASAKTTASEAAATTSTVWTPTTTWEPETTSKAPETTYKAPETTSTKVEKPETTSEAPASTWVPPTTSAEPVSTEKATTSSAAESTASASAKKCAKRKRSLAPAHMPARRASDKIAA